ncbi:hypothetical protein BB561_000229 [Smittium simulii]|uniref:Uncharacterized protein n=1 Tax=Smittium simulii TaxID=133385 RepID=A0A2T9YZU2_9FUNG|nr:hypothetical protein BB561_000229 [Smittium simulii]
MTIRWLFGNNSIVDLPDFFEKDGFGIDVLYIENFASDSGKTFEISQLNSGSETHELVARHYFLELCNDKPKDNCYIIEAGQLGDDQVPNLPSTAQTYYLAGTIQDSEPNSETNILIATFTIPEFGFDIVIVATETVSAEKKQTIPTLETQMQEYKSQQISNTKALLDSNLLPEKEELFSLQTVIYPSFAHIFFSAVKSYEIINFNRLF